MSDPQAGARRVVPEGWDPGLASRFGYSFGMRRDDHLWIAGQVALDGAGRPVAEGDIGGQATLVMERMRAIVETAGGTMDDIVRTTTYITDRAFRPTVNELRRKYFNEPDFPTNTLLVVQGLALPELLVEIEAEAVLR